MKIIQAILFGILLFGAICQAQDDTAKFRYHVKKAFPVRTVLHYVKTNIDGTSPEYVSQFIAAPAVMKSFEFHPQKSPARFVVCESARLLASDVSFCFG